MPTPKLPALRQPHIILKCFEVSWRPGYDFFSLRFDVCWKMHLGQVTVIQRMSSNARHSISWTFFSPLSLPRKPVAAWVSADAICMASGVLRR